MPTTNNTPKRRSSQPQPVDNTYGHLQPQAIEIEKAVLGALLIDKDAYAIVCELLFPESFYEPRNQMVYAAIRSLSMEELPAYAERYIAGLKNLKGTRTFLFSA